MSSDYRMNLIWTSQGQQLRADLERNIGGLTNFDRQMRGSRRELGLWGQQMRAVGTTIRYALAGTTVYAVASAVGGLGQFLDRLGEISALAGQLQSDGRLQGLGRELNNVGDIAVDLSNRFGIAVDEIQQHMVRFYSSFGDQVRGPQGIQQLREYAEVMSQISMFAEGADPQALGGGVAGMIIGATPPGSRINVRSQGERMRDIIAQVMQETPTVRGEDIARDIGRLGAAQTAARMTPEEIWAVYGVAARTGGSPAVIGRGVTQLLASEIIRPQTEAQEQAFRRAGLPTDPTRLRELGGMEILRRMMQAVAPGGASFSNPRAMATLGEEVDPEVAAAAAGGRGMNLTLASNLFGRQESFRQFLNIMSQGGVQALEDFVASIEEAKRANLGAQMADERNRQRAYQQLVQTQRNIGLQIARGIDPVTRPIARAVNRGGDWLTERPPAALVGGAAAASGAAIASRLIFGAGLFSMAGRALGRIPGLGGALGRNAARVPGLSAAALVGSGVGAFQATGLQGAGSRQNPFWVVIDPLSWFMPGAPSGGAPGAPTAPGAPGGRGGRWRSFARGGAAVAALRVGAMAAGAAAPLVVAAELDERRRERNERRDFHASRHRALAYALATDSGGFRASGQEARILHAYRSDRIDAPTAERRLRRLEEYQRLLGINTRGIAGTGMGFAAQVAGEAGVTIMLQPTPELAGLLRDVNRERRVPVKLHSVAGGQRPSFRGQRKTQRGGR